jgi:hypothetical protein
MFVIKRWVFASPLVVWLTRLSPPLWGKRENAGKSRNKEDARRAAASIKSAGAWSIEPARRIRESGKHSDIESGR